jgi:hypothetical protein
VSEQIAHLPLVDDSTFLTVQRIRANRPTKAGEHRHYVLAGLMTCGICGRRMDAHWVHDRPAYWCRHGYTSATPRPADAPRNVYLREDQLLDAIPALLADVSDTPAGAAGGRAQSDPVECLLRNRGLQIACTHQRQELRRARKAADSLPARGQTTPALDWNPHADEQQPRPDIYTRQTGNSASDRQDWLR